MKKKKQIWILMPLVLFIWGYIGFRIFDAVKENTEVYPVYQATGELESVSSDSSSSYELNLDYPDPFLKKRPKVAVTNSTAKSNQPNNRRKGTKVTKTIKPLPLRWPNVFYKGSIENKGGGKITYMISIDGVNNFLKEGDERKELKLLKAYKDSIRVQYQGKEKRTFLKL